MKIVCCMKQIPDTQDIKFDPESGCMKRDALPVTVNALDEHAVEEALRLKEKLGNATVTVLGMGPDRAVDALKHGIAMGADDAVLVSDPALAGSDSMATARVLSRAIASLDDVGLILCGAETIDGGTGNVGPAIARQLQLPFVAFVTQIEEISAEKAIVHRLMEQGRDRVETPLPCLLSVVKGINEPRISSLKGKMRAKKYSPDVKTAADLPDLDPASVGLEGSATRVVKTFPPEARPAGTMLEGEPAEIADQLYQLMRR